MRNVDAERSREAMQLRFASVAPVAGYKNISDPFVAARSTEKSDPTGGAGRNFEVVEHWDSLYRQLANEVGQGASRCCGY